MLLARHAADQIARIIAKDEGGFMFEPSFALHTSSHPQVRRWLQTSKAILEFIQEFLNERGLDWDALEIGQDYVMPEAAIVYAPYADARGFMPETSGYKLAENYREVSEFPTWDDLTEWVEELYLCWGVFRSERLTFEQYETDRIAALEDRLSHAKMQAFHHYLSEKVETPVFAPQRDKQMLAKAILEMLNPYPKALEINLYFKLPNSSDSLAVCVGAEAADHWARNHKGRPYDKTDYSFVERVLLPVGLNPTGQTITEISERIRKYKNPLLATEQVEATQPAQNAQETAQTSKTDPKVDNRSKAAIIAEQRRLDDIFGGDREYLKEQYTTIKNELTAVGVKFGKLISSQSTVKGWFVTWEGYPAALYWTVSNGWEIGTRKNQDELSGPWEGYNLIENLEANGVAAGDWDNARDEKAEAEAIELQQQEKAKGKKRFQLSFGSIPADA